MGSGATHEYPHSAYPAIQRGMCVVLGDDLMALFPPGFILCTIFELSYLA